MTQTTDLLVIGGGINGCGIAREAAGRGLSVLLCEKDDLASGTSSTSTKLIHGGLRYLEFYEFRLVREALIEREILWRIAPHIIRPLRFVLPYHRGLRPYWLLRLGLFIYDHLGGRERLPGTRTLDLSADETGKPLRPDAFRRGFEYSDCWVDDARLVVLNARHAADLGATIRTRTRVLSAVRENGLWKAEIENVRNGQTETVYARALVNAAGPWVGDVLSRHVVSSTKAQVRLVRGSHIVVPRVYDHDRCYIFQNADNRIVFAIPYEDDFTLIGTTDIDHRDSPDSVSASADEIAYLCASASEYFAWPIARGDVVWSYSGVRPLFDDGSEEARTATRDYVLKLEDAGGAAPLLSVFGGKITTYRRLALSAIEKLEPFFDIEGSNWSAMTPLPGGDFPIEARGRLEEELLATYPFLGAKRAQRLVRTYGTDVWELLEAVHDEADLGRDFGAGLTEAEIRYLMKREWAETAHDILWRRTKLGLHMTAAEIGGVERRIAELQAGEDAAAYRPAHDFGWPARRRDAAALAGSGA